MHAAFLIFSAAVCCLILQSTGSQIFSQTVAKVVQRTKPEYAFFTDVADTRATPARSALLTFLDLIRQRNIGNEVKQCPCVSAAGSDKCIAYDARFQAATLEEAIITFADTSMDLRIFDERIGGPITPNTFQCSSDECRQCVGMLVLRLRQIGMLQGNVEFPFAVPLEFELRPDGCPRLRMSHAVPDFIVPPTPAFVRMVINEGQRFAVHFEAAEESSLRQQIDQVLTINHASNGRPLITQFIAESRRSGTSSAVAASTSAVNSSATQSQQQQQNSQSSQSQQSQLPSQSPRETQQTQQQQTSGHTNREHVNLPFSMLPLRLIPVNNNNGRPGSSDKLLPSTRPPPGKPPSQQRPLLPPSQQPQPSPQQIPGSPPPQQRPLSQQQPQQQNSRPGQQSNGHQTQGQLNAGIRGNLAVNQQSTGQQQQVGTSQSIGLSVRQQGQFLQETQRQQVDGGLGHLRAAVRNHALNELNDNLVHQFYQQQSPEPRPEPHFESQRPANWPNPAEQRQQHEFQQQQQLQQRQLQQQQKLQLQQQQQFWARGQSQAPFTNPQTPTASWPHYQIAVNPQADVASQSSGGSWSGAANLVGGWTGASPARWGRNLRFAAPVGGDSGGGAGALGALGSAIGSVGNVGDGHDDFDINLLEGYRKRARRQSEDNIIGKRFVISCVERGEMENEDTDFINLCTACWTWRQLPEEYFPRLLNELVCNENDNCLSGWGECRQRFRNVDVLKRVNGNWRPTTISTASCCDCKVKAGSQIHGLVTGSTK